MATGEYMAPLIEIVEVAVERGIAESGGTEGIGDGGEQGWD